MKDKFSGTSYPAVLYKYRNFQVDSRRNKSHLDDLLNGEVYFPNPEMFNDPFDCDIPVDYREFIENPQSIEKLIEQGRSTFPDLFQNETFTMTVYRVLNAGTLTNLEFIEFLTLGMQKDLKKNFGIFSATAKHDNPLMWSHYSNSHSGFCYGIDSVTFANILKVDSIGKVNYSNKYPVVSPVEAGLKQLKIQLLSKAYDWRYEKEYRIILANKANFALKIPLTCINSIFLGLKISESDKKKILSYRSSHFSHAKFYTMNKSKNEFKLIANEI